MDDRKGEEEEARRGEAGGVEQVSQSTVQSSNGGKLCTAVAKYMASN